MYDIALDANTHDILLNDRDILFIDYEERIAQSIKIRLKSFLGEWFLDTSYGLPYFEEILVKNPSGLLIDALIREEIMKVDDVLNIDDLELLYVPKYRVLGIGFAVTTNYGVITDKEILGYGITN